MMLASASHPKKFYLQLGRGAQAVEELCQLVISNIPLPAHPNLYPTHISCPAQFLHLKNSKGEGKIVLNCKTVISRKERN